MGFSFIAYFRFTADSRWQRVFDFANGSPDKNIIFAQKEDTNQFRFSIFNGTTEYPCDGGTITYNTYQKFVGIYDPLPRTITTYINDSMVRSITLVNPIMDTRTLRNCYIGKSNWDEPLAQMDLGFLYIYNQVLSPTFMPTNAPVTSAPTRAPASIPENALLDSNINTAVSDYFSGNNDRKNQVIARYGDIPQWDVSRVTDMSGLLAFRNNIPDISKWDTSNVTNMAKMFLECRSFNQPLQNWNTSNVTNMTGMFTACNQFNQPLQNWDTSNVTSMEEMFLECTSFNQPLQNWDTGNVTNMGQMFLKCTSFNQPLQNWNTGNVTNMFKMFSMCISFNQPLQNWDTGNVTDMSVMFSGITGFNQDISNWNTSKVIYMDAMFSGCTSFNQPIQKWNTQSLIYMPRMFYNAKAFNQIICWDRSKIADITDWNVGSGAVWC